MSDGPQPAFKHVYHLSPLRLYPMPIAMACGVILLLCGALGAPDGSEDHHLFLVLAGVLAALLVPILGIFWQSRLVLSAEGIAHHQLGYTVRSSWQNLAELDLTAGREALTLTQPGTRSALLRAAARGVGAMPGSESVIGDGNLLAQGRVILLYPFMYHWRRGALREDITRCAPWLFEPAPSPRRA